MSLAPGPALAEAALGLIGAPFRLRGRDPVTGLDCVGVLAIALRRIGRPEALPAAYALRMIDIAPLLSGAADLGFVPVRGPARPGDVTILALGQHQHHLAIIAPDGAAIHAHAGLRRVVHGALPDDWLVIGRWRLTAQTTG
ncbi:MAG: hypothetical protein JSS36_11595 [Proteobacteria bacterium]|nr:hypothetical protein [Pseudomonadota bacterium]